MKPFYDLSGFQLRAPTLEQVLAYQNRSRGAYAQQATEQTQTANPVVANNSTLVPILEIPSTIPMIVKGITFTLGTNSNLAGFNIIVDRQARISDIIGPPNTQIFPGIVSPGSILQGVGVAANTFAAIDLTLASIAGTPNGGTITSVYLAIKCQFDILISGFVLSSAPSGVSFGVSIEYYIA